MANTNLYRVLCTNGDIQSIEGVVPPTECNDGHDIADISICINNFVDREVDVIENGGGGGGSVQIPDTQIAINDNSSKDRYTRLASFPYRGVKNTNAISEIKAICYKANGNSTMDIAVMDDETGDVICEVTGLDNTTPEIASLGAISNLPENESSLGLYVKSVNKKKKCYIETLSIIY